MFFPKAVFCRVFQGAFRMALPVFPYREPNVFRTPHGLANAVMMPYVLEAYGKRVHKKLHKLGIAARTALMHSPITNPSLIKRRGWICP